VLAKSLQNKQLQRARLLSEQGLAHYANWELSEAIDCLFKASQIEPKNADTYLNLARALARAGNYDLALKSITEFLQHEPAGTLASRFEQFYSTTLDKVESVLTEKMSAAGMPLEDIGAALQMWLEFRIAAGRESITRSGPQSWAAALDYTVRKVNFRDTDLDALADQYGTTAATIRKRHRHLLQTLDIMPCDYRYFIGSENPLDKLVEAATMLEDMERRFSED
jgi:hypothetical protein